MSASLFTSVLNIELKDSEGKVKLVYWWKNKHRIILMTGTTHQHHFESCVSLISFHFRKHPCYLKILKKQEHDLRAPIDWVFVSSSEERKISLTANENSNWNRVNCPKRGKTQVTKSLFDYFSHSIETIIEFSKNLARLFIFHKV